MYTYLLHGNETCQDVSVSTYKYIFSVIDPHHGRRPWKETVAETNFIGIYLELLTLGSAVKRHRTAWLGIRAY